jgi:hypothetical protein
MRKTVRGGGNGNGRTRNCSRECEWAGRMRKTVWGGGNGNEKDSVGRGDWE